MSHLQGRKLVGARGPRISARGPLESEVGGPASPQFFLLSFLYKIVGPPGNGSGPLEIWVGARRAPGKFS